MTHGNFYYNADDDEKFKSAINADFLFFYSIFCIIRNDDREHKYNCTSNSFMDAFLQPWWCWLVSKTPLWVAPNTLTIVGLLVNIITSLLLLYHAPDAKADAPRWCYLSCAIGLFIYQSLDAIGMFHIWFAVSHYHHRSINFFSNHLTELFLQMESKLVAQTIHRHLVNSSTTDVIQYRRFLLP